MWGVSQPDEADAHTARPITCERCAAESIALHSESRFMLHVRRQGQVRSACVAVRVLCTLLSEMHGSSAAAGADEVKDDTSVLPHDDKVAAAQAHWAEFAEADEIRRRLAAQNAAERAAASQGEHQRRKAR